jgi:glycosyltransferase involved in cell wall biosynthesis
MTKLKFNVIIPTRERMGMLYHSLRTVVAQHYENLNIIVSDNFSQDGTAEVVKSFKDSRIQYINTGSRMGMSSNWEFALNHVTDGWVMFIGDDDGLYPGAIEVLNNLVQKFNVEAVSSNHGNFLWPEHFLDYKNGALVIPLTSSVIVKNSKFEAQKVFAGKMAYQKLPWLYHGGAASLELINRLRDKNGRFFCSQIPDLYSAVALSLATETFLSVGTPLVIAGSSKHSNGASNLGIKLSGDGEGNPSERFKSENNIPFHESLIIGVSTQVMLYEAYLQSTHIHGDRLGITLGGQLHAAIKVAPKVLNDQIRNECQLIAAKNGLAFVDRYGKASRCLSALFRLPVILRTVFLRIQLEPRELGLMNIYDAAIGSSFFYKFIRNRPYVLILLGSANVIGRIFSKIKIAILRSLATGTQNPKMRG